MIFDRIMLPAQGRSEDYKFAQTGSATLVASVGGSGGGSVSWLEQYFEFDVATDTLRVKKHFVSEGEIAAWQEGEFNSSIFDNLPKASRGSYGVVKIGSNIDVTDGVISVSGSALNPTLGFVNNILSVNASTVDLSSLETDLSDYYNITQINTLLNGKANKNGSSTEDFTVKNLIVHGTVNHWLAQQLVVDDARIQVNRRQGGATVDSGLVIFDKDTSTEVSKLVYDVNGVWRAGGDRLFTEAYNPKLGGYAAGDYPRKAEDAVISGAWKFSGGSNYELTIQHSITVDAIPRSASLVLGRNASYHIWRMSSQSTQAWGNIPDLHFENKTTEAGAWAKRVTILFNGNVGINNAAPTERLHVVGNGLFTGNITAQGEVTAYQSSDRRLKSNIKPITSALDIIEGLNPVSYNWNKKAIALNSIKDDVRTNYGVIAQEVEKILPDLVHQTNGYKSVDYIQLIGVLLASVKELHNEIKDLKNR